MAEPPSRLETPSPPAQPSSRPEAHSYPAGTERLLITLAIILGTLMGAIDMSIINVALPDIRASLGVTLTEISWVATGYLVAVVVILPLTDWLSSVVGRKRLYIAAQIIFVTSSLFCGQSHSLPELVFFRVTQGLGAGLMQPIAMATLREVFPPREQAMAMGLFGIAILLGPAIGPTLGGWLTDNYGWPWIFYINLPIGAVAVFMASQFIYDPPYLKRQHVSSVDYIGILLLSVGLASLQTVLSEGQSKDWFDSAFVLALTATAVVALLAFTYWELRTRRPAVDLSILSNSTFTSGTMIGGVLGLALFGSLFLLPLFMQELLGYNAMQSGLAMLPRSIVMMIGMPIAGRLYNHLGPRAMIGSGLALTAVATLEMARFTLDTSYVGLVLPQVWQGLAFSLIFVSLSTASLARVPRPRLTNASALYNLVRQLGGSFGIAIIATMLEKHQQVAAVSLGGNLSMFNPAFVQRYQAISSGLIGRGVSAVQAPRAAVALLDGIVQRQAAVMAFDYTFYIVGVLFIIALPLIFLLSPRRHAVPDAHVE
jgi:DHA2 family multidrug resistance protein